MNLAASFVVAAFGLFLPHLAVTRDFGLSPEETSRRREIYQSWSSNFANPLIDGEDSRLGAAFMLPEGQSLTTQQDFYPDESKRTGEQGEVLLLYVLEVTGDVSVTEVLRPSESKRLTNAAIDMLKHMRYARPAMLDGSPVRVMLIFRASFTLKKL